LLCIKYNHNEISGGKFKHLFRINKNNNSKCVCNEYLYPFFIFIQTKTESLNRSRQFKNISYYNRIEDIPKEIWTDLNCSENLYFHPDYLQSIEKINGHLSFFYTVLKNDEGEAISLATSQVIDFYMDSLDNGEQGLLNTMACLARKFKILPAEKPLKILNCGNPFVSGEHGVFIKSGRNKRKVLRSLAKAILNYSQQNYSFPIDIFIMKDFVEESLPISNELISLGYYSFNVEPNMKLELNATWNSFEDYLAAMKTKFRVKAKKAFKLSKALTIENVSPENIEGHLKSMTELYQKVASKASFNLGEFNLKTYKDLREKLGKNYLLKSYWLDGQMVGFLSGMINQKTLDAHFVGIDYDLNRTHGIYQRMLYDYIDIAIQKKLEVVNFGRTASEIKSSVGAIPEHLTIYIRHKKSITNKFLKLFLLRIQPTEFNQKFPFKQEAIRS